MAEKHLILDVGSGHRPHPEANVLVDRYVEDIERCGKLFKHKRQELVIADIHYLPFKDKVFDFCYATHIFEHLDQPTRAARELERVAKRGYIEVPHWLYELILLGADYHKWYCFKRDKGIRMEMKTTKLKIIPRILALKVFRPLRFLISRLLLIWGKTTIGIFWEGICPIYARYKFEKCDEK